ncbi:MAG: hypothetical protein Ct9H300mP11_22700 [Chloroflexota bacterium]|nr:MAG: hypothetical protein Ct9H300mP11_22700 [Chloroflexota bacterium]
MELGQELERAAAAVDSAYAGNTVSVGSSGDAGIYGMSGPVFRVLTDRGLERPIPNRCNSSRRISHASSRCGARFSTNFRISAPSA